MTEDIFQVIISLLLSPQGTRLIKEIDMVQFRISMALYKAKERKITKETNSHWTNRKIFFLKKCTYWQGCQCYFLLRCINSFYVRLSSRSRSKKQKVRETKSWLTIGAVFKNWERLRLSSNGFGIGEGMGNNSGKALAVDYHNLGEAEHATWEFYKIISDSLQSKW